MNSAILLRGGARAATARSALLHRASAAAAATALAAQTGGRRASSSLPTIAQPSFWKSLVPKPLRQGDGAAAVGGAGSGGRWGKAKKAASKDWNPATFFIAIFLLIGSMSIQMIVLKRDYETFMRQSEAKIGLLREVVERIQKGEVVDVERMLGTGDPEKEAEWAAALKELERDDISRVAKRQEKKAAAATTPAPTAPTPTATPTPSQPGTSTVKVAPVSSFY